MTHPSQTVLVDEKGQLQGRKETISPKFHEGYTLYDPKACRWYFFRNQARDGDPPKNVPYDVRIQDGKAHRTHILWLGQQGP